MQHPVNHQQQRPAVVQSSGHQQRDVVEEAIQNVHVAQPDGDRGISPTERVLGLQQNKSLQSSDLQQQSGQWTTGTVAGDRGAGAAFSGLTIDTSAQAFQKSPSSSAGRYGLCVNCERCILWMAFGMCCAYLDGKPLIDC